MQVFVTVGTTSFDALIETVSSLPVKKVLESHGYRNLLIQKGRGSAEVETTKTSTFAVECYRYKDSISNDIKQADLVISHAGAGTCLEVLEAKRPLIVVVNEKLMNNHQFELAKQLYADNHLLYCTCSTLLDTLKMMDLSSLEPLPPPQTENFVAHMSDYFGLK